jgi:spore maturation protein CgeB
MKILLGYSNYKSVIDVQQWVEQWLTRLRLQGIDITGFCLTIDPPGPAIYWPELDNKWKRGDKKLFELYQDLSEKLVNYDVFINWNGINLHPSFVKKIPIFKAYGCFDDPESSEILSKPVCKAYDLCLVGNVAEVETYKQWGVKEVRFWPLGFFKDEFDPKLTEEKILTQTRDVDITLLCERKSGYRAERLDKFTNSFPNGKYYGVGWPNGFLAEDEKVPLYQRTRIGVNFHNSTGPINFRTYVVPANGVMLLCDNKSDLGKIYELGKEAIGFDTVNEAIELCRYYLDHEDERRKIALAGWHKATTYYNELAVFKLAMKYIGELKNDGRFKDLNRKPMTAWIVRTKIRNKINYFLYYFWVRVFKKVINHRI